MRVLKEIRESGYYISRDVVKNFVLAGEEVDGHQLILSADLLEAHQHPRHVRRHRVPEYLHRRHHARQLCLMQFTSLYLDDCGLWVMNE